MVTSRQLCCTTVSSLLRAICVQVLLQRGADRTSVSDDIRKFSPSPCCRCCFYCRNILDLHHVCKPSGTATQPVTRMTQIGKRRDAAHILK